MSSVSPSSCTARSTSNWRLRERRRIWGRFGGLTLVSVVAVILVLVFTNNTDLIRYLFEEMVPIATGVVGGGGGLALIINWNKLRES